MSISKTGLQLNASARLIFGLGAVGEAVYLGLFNGFITIYYNQAIGLSNTLIGAAIMLAMIGDAVTDPVVGLISDRWHSRFGRRHPFLFVAPVPLTLALYYIFNPPEFVTRGLADSQQWPVFAWLATLTILSRAFLTLYSIPHLALGCELSRDPMQRSKLFSANTTIGYLSGTTFGFIAWTYFFAGERVRESDGLLVPGHLDVAAYGPLVFTACGLILVAIWICALGTYKYVPYLAQAESNSQRLTIIKMLKAIGRTFRNRNYVILLVGYFFFMIASGIFDTLNVFVNTYFWELPTDKIRWLGLIGAPAAVCGALCSPHLMRSFDRRPVMLMSMLGVTLFAQLAINLRLLGILPDNQDPALLPFLLANAAGFTFCLGVGSVATMSMIGDIVDEIELESCQREEGLYYSARAFFAKASYSFGHLFAGLMLDNFVQLPFNTVPGQLSNDVLLRMGLTAGPIMGVAGFVSVAIYYQYDLNRERHAEILRAIVKRRERAAVEDITAVGKQL